MPATLAPITINPDWFDPAAAPADAERVNAAILAKLVDYDQWSQPIAKVREIRRSGAGPFPAPVLSPRAKVITIPGPRGPLELRVMAPDKPRGVYLHIHGGGWVLGTADMMDWRMEAIVDALGLAVVSVEYGLGPENPYPEGPDDCEAAALWLAREGGKMFGTDRFVIGGESAGAHLSVVTLLRLRDRHGLTPFRGANLHAGCYDLALTPSVRNWGSEKLILNTRDIENFVRHFTVRGGDVRHPDISPIHADLRGLPPALFTVGSRDPLMDDTLFMAPRYLAAGNATEMEVYPGGCHVFVLFPGANSVRCLERINAFMERCVAS